MAHYVPSDGFENFTGALSKKKIQGVNHMTVTRRKRVKDPLARTTHDRRALQAVPELREGGIGKREERGIERRILSA